MTTEAQAKELIFKIVLAVAGAALMMLIAIVGFIGRSGLQKMDVLAVKIDGLAQNVNENRSRVLVLEENRKQMDIVIRELQQINRNVSVRRE